MLDHEQLIPAEQEEENQLLIEDLSRYFDTQAEDRASLANIRARLLQKTAAALPVADNLREIEASAPLPIRRERDTGMKFIHAVRQKGTRYPYLNTLVAAALLVLLVGSFALALNRGPATTIGSSPTVAHGWSILTSFSGTGNKTITGLDIEVGHKYGWLLTCTNTSSGMVYATVNANDSGGTDCAAKIPSPLTPQSSSSAQSSGGIGLPPILTIDVKADASTSWKLWLFEGVYYPPLRMIDSDFHPLHDEIDGTGNMPVVMDVTIPRTFVLEFVCYGHGTLKLDIPEIGESTVVCNGQPQVNVRDRGAQAQEVIVHQIQITTGLNNDWQVLLGGCANAQSSCGIN